MQFFYFVINNFFEIYPKTLTMTFWSFRKIAYENNFLQYRSVSLLTGVEVKSCSSLLTIFSLSFSFIYKNASDISFIASKPLLKHPADQGRPIQYFKPESFNKEAAFLFLKLKLFKLNLKINALFWYILYISVNLTQNQILSLNLSLGVCRVF